MDRVSIYFLAILGLICVWLGDYQVSGKCSGKWAIHACAGGNGKRSETKPTHLIQDTDTDRNKLEALRDIIKLATSNRYQVPDFDSLEKNVFTQDMIQPAEMEDDNLSRQQHLEDLRNKWRHLVHLLHSLKESQEK